MPKTVQKITKICKMRYNDPEVNPMAKYQVEINETLSRIIEVEAENENDAVSKIKDLYRKEEIVLDSNNYLDTKIEIYEE